MLSRTLATIALLSILVTPAFAINFVQAASGLSVVIVNLQNGNITICPLLTNATSNPFGGCTKMGTINVDGVNGDATNMQITSSDAGAVAAVTNLTNGAVTLCSTLISNTTGAPMGICKAKQAF
jgi:hypothetical protein